MSPDIVQTLKALRDPEKAAFFPRFFKTGKGQYGEGDKFLGITVPQVRSVVAQFHHLYLLEIDKLLKNPFHEVRLAALLVLVAQFEKAKDAATKKKIVDFYLKHLEYVNNWDLVDATASRILGVWLLSRPASERKILYTLSKSTNLWKQRVAIIATLAFIILGHEYADTLKLSEWYFTHPHDLIHKATGWMLREVGKKDSKTLEAFLKKHAAAMPRTALRYSIERFPEAKRKAYLRMKA